MKIKDKFVSTGFLGDEWRSQWGLCIQRPHYNSAEGETEANRDLRPSPSRQAPPEDTGVAGLLSYSPTCALAESQHWSQGRTPSPPSPAGQGLTWGFSGFLSRFIIIKHLLA